MILVEQQVKELLVAKIDCIAIINTVMGQETFKM